VLAVAALVDQIQREVDTRFNVSADLVLTGGDAEVLQKALGSPCRIERDLVIQGLVEIIKDGAD
jgi:pantothenate kinase type III